MTSTTPDLTALNSCCVATTGNRFSTTTLSDGDERGRGAKPPDSKAFREAQFSADGTTIVTQHADHCLRSFVLSEHLLDRIDYPQTLSTHCTLPSATPVRSYSLYPHFNLQDLSTTTVACAAQDLPIGLVNAVHPDVVHARYRLINPMTEAYIAPSSLTWSRDGCRLIAGSSSLLSMFDASRDGSAPFLQHKLAHSKGQRKQQDLPDICRGIVNALSISTDGILAIGTLQSNLALYALEGAGECTTSLALPSDQFKGDGITHLAWSPCGTYLLVAERLSDCIQVYDMRNMLQRVSVLTGRNARTAQLLGIDVIPTSNGFEVWGGGKDGCVRVWNDPGATQDEQRPSSVMSLHQYPVSDVAWHPQGAVLATCTGRDFKDEKASLVSTMHSASHHRQNSFSMNESDNVMKIWTV